LGEKWHAARRVAERAHDHAVTQRERLRVTLASIGDAVIVMREEGFEQATIVAISGYGQAVDKERSREAGFDDHLVKPVDRDVLSSALRRVRVDVGADI
jgi:CheY-like chemotaxis protein